MVFSYESVRESRMAVYVDAAEVEDAEEEDLKGGLSAVRKDVEAKVRQSMPMSLDDGPAMAGRREDLAELMTATAAVARNGRATAFRNSDMVIMCWPGWSR